MRKPNSFQYSYDPGKNITKRTQNGVEDAFTYDKLNRIATSTENQDAYSYDVRGNRLTMESERAPHTKPRENSFDIRTDWLKSRSIWGGLLSASPVGESQEDIDHSKAQS